MTRVVVYLRLAPGAPSPVVGGHRSLFGAWLRERIASIAIDWPAVGFCRIDALPDGVGLVLITRAGAPPAAVGAAIARAVRTEVQAAALACCGLAEGATLWRAETVIMAERDSGRQADAA